MKSLFAILATLGAAAPLSGCGGAPTPANSAEVPAATEAKPSSTPAAAPAAPATATPAKPATPAAKP